MTVDPDAVYAVEQLQEQRNTWVSRANEYARQRDDAHQEIAEMQEAGDQLRAVLDGLIRYALNGGAYLKAAGFDDAEREVERLVSETRRLLGREGFKGTRP